MITAIGLFSLAAIVNLQAMTAPRIIYRMARDGAAPPILARVTRGRRPVGWRDGGGRRFSPLSRSMGSYENIVKIYAPWSMATIAMVCVCAIRLRVIEPDLPRPWKMPLFPWIAIGAAAIQAGLIIIVVVDDPFYGLLSALAAVAPLPIYPAFSGAWRRGAAQR